MEEKFAALVYKSEDYRENDKKLLLITPLGAKTAVMRGVKKPSAKMRFAAMPFAFCEYLLAEKNGFYTVTGASQLDDLFSISEDTDRLTAGGIILESAYAALKAECAAQFVFTLRRIKEAMYGVPYLAAIRHLQYIIHDAGYGYEYVMPDLPLDTPIKLLAHLSTLPQEDLAEPQDPLVTKKTLIKLIDNFEKKFEIILASKKFI